MSSQKLLLSFIGIAFFLWLLLAMVSKNVTPYSATDSASYIEAAQNFKAGKGLTVSTFGAIPVAQDSGPLSWWPPGYPLLISLISSFNVDEKSAAVFVPQFFFLLLPPAFFIVFRFFMRDTMAFCSAAIITLMWPTIATAAVASSDIPFLWSTLIAFFFIFRSLDRNLPRDGFVSGAISAVTIAIRHIGYNLVLGIVTGLFLALLSKSIPRVKYFRIQAAYFLGFTIAYLPLFMRNIFVLHTIQPYHLPLARITLFEPALQYFKEIACMLLGIWPSHGIYILGTILLFLPIIYYLRNCNIYEKFKENPFKATCFFIFGAYFFWAFLLFTLIGPLHLGQTYIEFRLLLPHTWLIVMFFIIATEFFLQQTAIRLKINSKWPVLTAAIIFLAAQFYTLEVWASRQKPYRDLLITLEKSTPALDVIRDLPDDSYIISNCGPYLRLLTGRSVRKLSRTHIDITPQELADLVCPKRDLYVILVHKDKANEILPESWQLINDKTTPKGYQCRFNDGTIMILYHKKEITDRFAAKNNE